jgi:hypothetical protein
MSVAFHGPRGCRSAGLAAVAALLTAKQIQKRGF